MIEMTLERGLAFAMVALITCVLADNLSMAMAPLFHQIRGVGYQMMRIAFLLTIGVSLWALGTLVVYLGWMNVWAGLAGFALLGLQALLSTQEVPNHGLI